MSSLGRFNKNGIKTNDLLLMYRQYATLYVVFCVDKAENELAILDLIQVKTIVTSKTQIPLMVNLI